MAGTRTRPRGSPGQHARLWASKRRLLQPPSCTASGGPDFRGVYSTQRHPSMDPDKGRPESPHQHPGIRIRPRSSPGLNAEVRNSQLPPLYAAFVEVGSALACKALPTGSSMARGAWAAEEEVRVAGTRTRPRGSPGQQCRSMRASGRASASSCSPRLAQLREGRIFGFSPPNGIHRWMRIRGVRNHFISTRSSDTGFGPAWGLSSRFGTQNSLPCIAWRSWRRGRVGSCF